MIRFLLVVLWMYVAVFVLTAAVPAWLMLFHSRCFRHWRWHWNAWRSAARTAGERREQSLAVRQAGRTRGQVMQGRGGR